MSLPPRVLEPFYRSLYRIRRVEEEIIRIYPSDKIKSPVHLSIGQEAVAVGVCEALRRDDVVFGTYRSHALYLAKGGSVREMMAELYGKATGCAQGKGGSMHLVSVSAGMMGTSAVVATTVPEAVGYAYAFKQQRKDCVVASFMGDGAVEEGAFPESLNFAALKKLPVLFIVENNRYAIHTHQTRRHARDNICERAIAFGVPAERIEDNDGLKIYEQVQSAVAAMRNGTTGPRLFECMTYRWREHVGPGLDFHLNYRTEEEARSWIENDQLKLIGNRIPESRRRQIEAEVEAEIEDAIAFAEQSPFPVGTELWTDLFAETPAESLPEASPAATGQTRSISFAEAVREAADQEMAHDHSVLVFGLDVDDPKAILGTTKGLLERYGAERLFGTPLSEDAMAGVAIGMALAGLRPVHVHIRMDFLILAMNQLVNMAAKSRYMFGGQVKVPLVARAMIGKSWGQGAQHSQALHALFMHVPGLKVVAPATPYDAKGCLIHAIRDNNPVIYVEHRLLHYQKGPVPEQRYSVPPGKARITAHGNDLTLVGISYMQLECLRAQKYLETAGIQAEVIDPIWLSPLDMDTIVESVRRTGHLLVVDNGWMTCGASAEIVARTVEALQGSAVFRCKRMGFAPVPCPTTPSLESEFYPNACTIAAAAHRMLRPEAAEWVPDERPEFKLIEFKGPF